MQKVVVGRAGQAGDLERYLNQQIQNNPGWRIDHIYPLDCGCVGPMLIVVFEGPEDTNGPRLHCSQEEPVDDESKTEEPKVEETKAEESDDSNPSN